jgi:hypothetical protein
MLLISIKNETKKTYLIPFINNSSRSRFFITIKQIHSNYIAKKATYLTVPLTTTINIRSMWKWNTVKAIAKKFSEVPEVLNKELTMSQSIPVPKISGTFYKQFLPAPLIYTPKDFRFWIIEDPNKNRVPGLASLTTLERKILIDRYLHSDSTTVVYCTNFAKIICFIKAMIFTKCFSKQLSVEELFNVLPQIFVISETSLWFNNPAFRKLFQAKAPAMIQHFLGMTYGTTTFKLTFFDEKNLGISCDKKTGSIGTLNELQVIHNTCGDFIKKEANFEGRVIDSNSALLESGDIFKRAECKSQINQQNGDVFFFRFKMTECGVKIITIYRDVKMDYKGPFKGHFNYNTFISTDYKALKTWLNDYHNYLKYLLTKDYSEEVKLILNETQAFVQKQHHSIKKEKSNWKEIYSLMKEKILELSFNETLVNENIHFTVSSDLNENKDPIIEEIVNRIEQDPDVLQYADPEIHYPVKAHIKYIPWEKYYKISLKGIRSHVPEMIQESVIENYTRTYLDFMQQNALLPK